MVQLFKIEQQFHIRMHYTQNAEYKLTVFKHTGMVWSKPMTSDWVILYSHIQRAHSIIGTDKTVEGDDVK